MDSIRIYNRSHWYRWSRQFDKGNNGGSQIDFLRVFCGMSVKAVSYTHLDVYKRQLQSRKKSQSRMTSRNRKLLQVVIRKLVEIRVMQVMAVSYTHLRQAATAL